MVKHSQSTQNNKFAISLQYVKENAKIEACFLLADKHQILFQIYTIILGLCGLACPNYPKYQLCYFQYLMKEESDEVDFLHTDKHESFLQIEIVIFDGAWSSIPKVTQYLLYNIQYQLLMFSCDHIICPGLSFLFLYTPAHKA